MKLETFFEKFELFADAPDAVAKMRELVLRLATSGKIARQDPTDQPASELLSEIFAKRKMLLGKIPKQAESARIAAGDTIDLPESWARCTISEVCELQTGATPSRQEPSYFGGEIRWLVSGDVNKRVITECEGRISEKGLAHSNCKLIPANSVLIALNGQGKTRATVAILRISAALNQSLVAMIPYSPERLLPEYIFWNLRGRYFAIRDVTGQDQRRGLNMKLIGQLTIPIPPLAEQKRIVAKVDELMALCDRLEAQQQERKAQHAVLSRAALARFAEAPTPANLEFLFHDAYDISAADLRKSILTLAVQGKLVPQDPRDEPPAETFSELAPVAVTRPDELPEVWLCVPLSKVGEWRGGGTPSKSRADFWSGDIPWVSPKDMKVLRLLDAQDHISSAAVEESSVQIIPSGSLLIVVRGMILARAFPVALAARTVTINQDMKALLPSSPEMKDFLLLVLRALEEQALAAIERSSHGTCKLKTEALHRFVIPIPPLAEQRRIVAKVDELMALVDKLETQLATARTTATNLLAAAVAELARSEQHAAAADTQREVEEMAVL